MNDDYAELIDATPGGVSSPQELRQQAERQLGESGPGQAQVPGNRAVNLRQQLQLQQHELSVHQIELTLQNEELQRSNAELERARLKYHSLYDLAPVGYLSLDVGGHLLEINSTGAAQLGLSRGELLGRRLLLFTHEQSREALAGFLEQLSGRARTDQARAEQARGRLEVTLLRRGGSPLEVQLDAVVGEQSIRLSITDITPLKEIQRRVLALNETLEARVLARTSQVRELNEELLSFVQSTMRALDTPLRHISGFAALLGGGPADKQQHYLEEVVNAAGQVEALTEALTEYFRLGHQPLHFLPVNLNRVMDEVKKSLATWLEGRSVIWDQDVLPTVRGDSYTLQMVFRQLIDNALKFSVDRPETHIRISAQETEREYIIAVADNGVGLNAYQQARVFVLFQRLHSSSQVSNQGQALGLASVRRIVLRHGGRVWASGEAGEGSCFWVALPKDAAVQG